MHVMVCPYCTIALTYTPIITEASPGMPRIRPRFIVPQPHLRTHCKPRPSRFVHSATQSGSLSKRRLHRQDSVGGDEMRVAFVPPIVLVCPTAVGLLEGDELLA